MNDTKEAVICLVLLMLCVWLIAEIGINLFELTIGIARLI